MQWACHHKTASFVISLLCLFTELDVIIVRKRETVHNDIPTVQLTANLTDTSVYRVSDMYARAVVRMTHAGNAHTHTHECTRALHIRTCTHARCTHCAAWTYMHAASQARVIN